MKMFLKPKLSGELSNPLNKLDYLYIVKFNNIYYLVSTLSSLNHQRYDSFGFLDRVRLINIIIFCILLLLLCVRSVPSVVRPPLLQRYVYVEPTHNIGIIYNNITHATLYDCCRIYSSCFYFYQFIFNFFYAHRYLQARKLIVSSQSTSTRVAHAAVRINRVRACYITILCVFFLYNIVPSSFVPMPWVRVRVRVCVLLAIFYRIKLLIFFYLLFFFRSLLNVYITIFVWGNNKYELMAYTIRRVRFFTRARPSTVLQRT